MQRKIKSHNHHLPWLSHDIKSKMKEQKKLYDKAKRTHLPEDWNVYQVMRNTANVLLDTTHKDYCTNLFKESFTVTIRSSSGHILKGYRKTTLVYHHLL